jgi:hypothetical protein
MILHEDIEERQARCLSLPSRIALVIEVEI